MKECDFDYLDVVQGRLIKAWFGVSTYLTRFNKIAIQGTLQMAVDKEAISLSRVYSYDAKCTCPYSMRNPP